MPDTVPTVIDESLLADPRRCPSCSSALPSAPPACPTCRLPLHGPLAAELWDVSRQASTLLERRADLLARLRTSAAGSTSGVQGVPGESIAPPAPDPEGRVGPGSVRTVLLGLGVLLLGVAAFIFTVFAWSRFGIGGRAAILTAVTAAGVAGARVAERRRLPATAESLALLTVGLLLLDAYALRRLGLAGASLPGEAYWAGVLAALAAVGAIAARASRLLVPRLAAASAAQLPVPVLLELVPVALDWASSLALTGQALAVLGVAARGLRRPTALVRYASVLGAALAWLGAVGLALPVAWGWPGVGRGGGLLALAASALVPVCAARAYPSVPTLRHWGVGASSLLLLATGYAAGDLVGWTSPDRAPLLAAGLAGLLAGAAALTRESWRPGVVAGAGVAALLAFPGTVPVFELLLGQLAWLDRPWTVSGLAPARHVASPAGAAGAAGVPLGTAIVGAMGLAAALAVLGAAARVRRAGLVGGGLLAVVGLAALPALTGLEHVGAVAAQVLLGIGVLGATAAEDGHGVDADDERGTLRVGRLHAPVIDPESLAGLVVGLGLLGTALAWAEAARTTTLLVFPVVTAGLAAVAALAPARSPLVRPVPTGAAVGLLSGTGVLLGFGLGPAGLGPDRAAVVGAALAVACALVGQTRPLASVRPVVEGSAAAMYAGWLLTLVQGPVGSGSSAWPLVVALTIGGLGAAVVAVRADRRRAGVLSGVLLTAASWVRLADADVSQVEAYSLPPALALLAVGALRRRRDPGAGSWPAYGPGLSAGLLPSLLASLGDDGLARPLLLGAVALGVLLVGARLRALLALGGGVLAVDAIAQLLPYAGLLPRWVSLGAVGLLLLAVGATYERRLRDLHRLRGRYEAMS